MCSMQNVLTRILIFFSFFRSKQIKREQEKEKKRKGEKSQHFESSSGSGKKTLGSVFRRLILDLRFRSIVA